MAIQFYRRYWIAALRSQGRGANHGQSVGQGASGSSPTPRLIAPTHSAVLHIILMICSNHGQRFRASLALLTVSP